jgi:hypothetical protein
MRRGTVLLIAIIVVVAAGVGLPAIVRARANADKVGCLSRFERLGQFAAIFHKPPPGPRNAEVPLVVPPGTIPNQELPPDRRLSWIPDILPFLDQTLQRTDNWMTQIERSGTWDSAKNTEVGKIRLALFTCPGAIPEVPDGSPMPTQFIGLSGLGPDSAALTLGPPIPARAGCFRYDSPTPLRLIQQHDGLSNTLLFAETANELGPWMRGGFSTVRGLDLNKRAKRPIGMGGQFGGNYRDVAGFGFADGSARFFTERTSDDLLRTLFTIAGQDSDPLPGE